MSESRILTRDEFEKEAGLAGAGSVFASERKKHTAIVLAHDAALRELLKEALCGWEEGELDMSLSGISSPKVSQIRLGRIAEIRKELGDE